MKLSVAVRETTPAGAKQVSHAPNLLARPVYCGCRVCGLPGHQSADIQHPAACRVALLSLIGFWEVVADHVSFLYQYSERFQKAIQANEPTYAMRFDNPPLKGGDMEAVLVDRHRVRREEAAPDPAGRDARSGPHRWRPGCRRSRRRTTSRGRSVR